MTTPWGRRRAAKRQDSERRAVLDRRVKVAEAAVDAALLRYAAASVSYADAVARQVDLDQQAAALEPVTNEENVRRRWRSA